MCDLLLHGWLVVGNGGFLITVSGLLPTIAFAILLQNYATCRLYGLNSHH